MTLEEKLEEAIVKEAPYEVPRNWVWSKLNVICDVRDGTHDSPSYLERGIPLITSKNLRNGEISFENVNYISEEDHELISKRSRVDEGDILFAMIGTIGNPVLVKNISQEFSIKNVALFKSRKMFIDKYIYYYVQSFMYEKQLEKNLKGSTQKFIALGKLRDSVVPVPPLNEQQRIVDRIESLFEKLDRAKELIEEAREGFENRKAAILEKAFRGELTREWREKTNLPEGTIVKIKDIAELISGQHIPSAEYNMEEKGISYLTGPADFGDINPIVTKWTESPKVVVSKGDVLITVKGSGVGKVNLLHLDNVCISRQLMAIRGRQVNSDYIFWFLKSMYNKLQAKSTGTAIPGLSRGDILDIEIYRPSEKEEIEIVDILNRFMYEESKIDKLSDIGDYIEVMKKSILAKAFRGELGTHCDEDESALELLKEVLQK